MLSILRTDTTLVAQVLSGKRNGFDELVRRHFSVVYGVAFSYTHNHTDAEDLSQEAFLKAYKSLDSLLETKKFGHWVCTITRNLARTWFARRKREAEVMEHYKTNLDDKKEVSYDDKRELLEQCIDTLDPIPREVLVLHYFSEQSTREIADLMNVSQAAVLKRLQRAREALGVKLIHELHGVTPFEHDLKQNRSKIMSTISVSAIPWDMSGHYWGSAVVNTVMTGKGLVLGLLITGTVVTSLSLNPTPEPKGNAAVPLSAVGDFGDMDTIEASVQYEALSAPEERERAVPSLVLAEALPEEPGASEVLTTEAVEEEKEEQEDPELLKGDWRVLMSVSSDATFDEIGVTQIIREGNHVALQKIKYLGEITIEGDVLGDKARLNLWMNKSQAMGELVGVFTPDFKSVTVSGEVDFDGDGGVDQVFYLRLVKMSQEEKDATVAVAEAKERLELLQKAIRAYMKKEEAGLTRLADLYPDFISDEVVLRNSSEERLSYYPVSVEQMNFEQNFSNGNLESWRTFIETGEPIYLLELEAELAVLWGKNFPGGHRLLRLTNTRYDFVLAIDKEGRISEESMGGEEQIPEARRSALHASCQNNMKQLGLVFKMYENESLGEYIPGGFRQVYPEYLTDLNVLICPGLKNATVGYEILFPASRSGFWKELFGLVEGLDADEYRYQQSVPWMIEKEDCSGSGGRNVLFADGHVELIQTEDWEARMGPYMKHAYK